MFQQLAFLLLDIPKPIVHAILYITRWHLPVVRAPVNPNGANPQPVSEMEYNVELYHGLLCTLYDTPFFLLLIVNSLTWRTVAQYKALKQVSLSY